MSKLFTGISQLASPTRPGPKRGAGQSRLEVVNDAALIVNDGRIVWMGSRDDVGPFSAERIDLGGRAVVPGLTDPHTHAVWAGDRLADFEARAAGRDYQEILRRGGGIRSTIRDTAAATVGELISLAEPRIQALLNSGATVIEVKSGYGYSPEAEVRMLEAVRGLQQRTPARLVPTLLIHVPPEDPAARGAYVEMVVTELIPEVARRGLAHALDVFTETESFNLAETERILSAAADHDLKFKLHADQFNAIGGTELAVELGALSVDHLEAAGPAQVQALAHGNTVATLLPGVSLHLGLPGAPGRALVDAGVPVALATDLNPGSSPLPSVSLVQALAVRLCGLSPSEALVAGTVNAAAALDLGEQGRLEAGCPADFLVLNGQDWRQLSYDLSGRAVAQTWIAGNRVDSRA